MLAPAVSDQRTFSEATSADRSPVVLSPPSGAADSWSLASHYPYVSFDRAFKANLARLTLSLSPAVLAEQTFDWLAHLTISPGKQLQLIENWFRNSDRFSVYAAQIAMNTDGPPYIMPSPQVRRFQGEAWQRWPYNLIRQPFLLVEQWWDHATTEVDRVAQRNERRYRPILDIAWSSNYVWTLREVAQVTIAQGGRYLVEGF